MDGKQSNRTNDKSKKYPGQIDNGIDQQLLRSIKELLKDVN